MALGSNILCIRVPPFGQIVITHNLLCLTAFVSSDLYVFKLVAGKLWFEYLVPTYLDDMAMQAVKLAMEDSTNANIR